MEPTLPPRFRLERKIQDGGMGVVWAAEDLEEGIPVALKTFRVGEARGAEAAEAVHLRREFRVLAGIRHPNLIELYELFTLPEACFFTMELIDGRDLMAALRGGRAAGELPEAELPEVARVFRDVALALAAVHDADCAHRDLKPSNIMITRAGRAVVLDFGVAAVLRLGAGEDGLCGSPEYMAPEAAWSGTSGTGGDWYAFGVVLYEVLCGALPFEGKPGMILRQKTRAPAPPLDERVRGLPPALTDLVARLLDREPAARPGAAEVVAVLEEVARLEARAGERAALAPRLPFVGRQAELKVLDQSFQDVQEGRAPARLVLVRGRSGIGKTELVVRHLAQLRQGHGAEVFSGRCQPQEQVPFNAFDAVVDEIALALGRAPPAEIEPLVPPGAASMLRLFPALEGVPALDAVRDEPVPREPRELRGAGVAALRELLTRLAAAAPLVLHLDDLQWADLDSIDLLVELLQGASPPRVTVVATHRVENEASSSLQRLYALAHTNLVGRVRTVDVGPLTEADASELAGRLGAGRTEAASLLQQAAGSPFMLSELVRYQRAVGASADGRVSAEDAVWSRVLQLGTEERALVEVVSAAGHPLDATTALRAAGLHRGGRRRLYRLDGAFVRRVTSPGGEDGVEPLHDRIREVVAARLDEERRRAVHRAIATELRARPEAEPQLLLEHYRKAGELREAAGFAALAAERAEASLAFGLAADLHLQTLELRGDRRDWRLEERIAGALVNAGRSGDAAPWYARAAADLAEAEPSAPQATRLERLAAEQYMHAGRLQRGLGMLAEGLRRVGAVIPRSPLTGLLCAAWLRFKLMWRGARFVARDPSSIDPQLSARLDTLWGGATALSLISHTRSDPLGVEHLLLSLDSGDAVRIQRALRYELAFEMTLGSGPVGRLARRALGVERMVAEMPLDQGDPYNRAWAALCDASVSWFRGDWQACARAGLEGEEVFRRECRGVHWEVAVIDLFVATAIVYLGDVAVIRERMEARLRDAERREDEFAANLFRLGQPMTALLLQDRAEEAVRGADRAIAAWAGPGFTTQHYHHLLATAQAALYLGDPWDARSRMEAGWGGLRGSTLLFIDAIRVEMWHLRGRIALAASGVPDPGGRRGRRALLREAARAAARTAGLDAGPWGVGMARSLEGALAAEEGRQADARRALAEAVLAFEAASTKLLAAAARHRLALAEERWEDALGVAAALGEEGVVRPARLLAMLLPAPALDARAEAVTRAQLAEAPAPRGEAVARHDLDLTTTTNA